MQGVAAGWLSGKASAPIGAARCDCACAGHSAAAAGNRLGREKAARECQPTGQTLADFGRRRQRCESKIDYQAARKAWARSIVSREWPRGPGCAGKLQL